MVLNLVWAALSLPWVLAACLLLPSASFWAGQGRPDAGVAVGAFALCIGLVSPATLGLVWAVGPGDGRFGGPVRQALRGFRDRFWQGQALGLLMAGVAGLLGLNAGFYGGMRGPAGWALTGMTVWCAAAFLALAPFWAAATATGEGVLGGLRVSLRLAAAHPLRCAGVSTVAGVILLGGVATVAGGFLGAVSLAALWVRTAFEAMTAAGAGGAVALSEGRSLRALWRPWENRN